jgi:signal peptidase I
LHCAKTAGRRTKAIDAPILKVASTSRENPDPQWGPPHPSRNHFLATPTAMNAGSEQTALLDGLARAMSLRQRLRTVSTWGLTMALLLVARASFADHYRVPSGSMEPTVKVGDHVLVDKVAYGLRVPLTEYYAVRFATPERGDVVVLDSPESGDVLLKRLIARGGDEVRLNDGILTINGRVRTELLDGVPIESLDRGSHGMGLDYGSGPDLDPLRIPSGRVLVLGDNRGNSRDSRFFGLVSESAILGRAEAIVWRDGHATWIGL